MRRIYYCKYAQVWVCSRIEELPGLLRSNEAIAHQEMLYKTAVVQKGWPSTAKHQDELVGDILNHYNRVFRTSFIPMVRTTSGSAEAGAGSLNAVEGLAALKTQEPFRMLRVLRGYIDL